MTRRHSALALSLALLVLGGCGADPDGRVLGELSSERIELSLEAGEPVVAIEVAEGTEVKAGDLLIRQDDRRARARVAEQAAVVAEAQARLDELLRGPRSEQITSARAAVRGAEDELAFRDAELTRIAAIREKNLAAEDAVDRASAALKAARAGLDQRRAELEERLNGATLEQLAQAEQAKQRAQARLRQLEIDLERHHLVAPVAGIADRRLVEVGETPQPGRIAFVLLPGAQPHAHVYIPQAMRARLQPGDAARIYIDGLPEPVSGRIRWIASEAAFTPYYALTERDRGRLTFAAKVDITDDSERLPEGLPVEVEFVPDD